MTTNDRFLFKAKREDFEKHPKENWWVIGSYVHTLYGDYIISGEGIVINIIPDTLCSCTGLRDKNDNLIYEHDLIRESYEDGDEYALSEVIFESNQWCLKRIKLQKKSVFVTVPISNITSKYEIVGNNLDRDTDPEDIDSNIPKLSEFEGAKNFLKKCFSENFYELFSKATLIENVSDSLWNWAIEDEKHENHLSEEEARDETEKWLFSMTKEALWSKISSASQEALIIDKAHALAWFYLS